MQLKHRNFSFHMLGCFPGEYFHTLPIRVSAAQRGRDFEAPDFRTGYPFQRRCLERGIIFRTHESSSFVSSHLKLFNGQIAFKNTVQCVNKQTAVLLLHPVF